MKLWKILGLAGLAGVAATGVIIAREQRQRAQLGPDEVRSRLHARLAAAGDGAELPAVPAGQPARQVRWIQTVEARLRGRGRGRGRHRR